MMRGSKAVFIAILLLGATDLYAADKILITVYAYHLKPPYIIDIEKEKGLYYDFSRYLSKKAGKFQFHTLYIPRKRAEVYLKNNKLDGALIGVNPLWFRDKDRTKYLWTPTIFDDQDEVVSLAEKPIEYLGPNSLINKKLGGVLGYYYYGIDGLVNEGKIERTNTSSEKAVMKLILSGRVDVGIVSRSTYHYLTIKENWEERFHLSMKPHDAYTRHVLVPRENKEIYDYMLPFLEKLNSDHEWRRILKKYR